MNEKNKKFNIQEEVNKGDEAYQEAKVLFNEGLYTGCISRAYYSAFHYTLAILLTIGLEPKSHQGAHHLFSIHFVQRGIIETEYRTILKRAEKWRLESDYRRKNFDKKEAEEEMNDVSKFNVRIKTHLKEFLGG